MPLSRFPRARARQGRWPEAPDIGALQKSKSLVWSLKKRIDRWKREPWRSSGEWVVLKGKEGEGFSAEEERVSEEKERKVADPDARMFGKRRRRQEESVERVKRKEVERQTLRQTAEQDRAKSSSKNTNKDKNKKQKTAILTGQRLPQDETNNAGAWLWQKVVDNVPSIPKQMHIPALAYTIQTPAMPNLSALLPAPTVPEIQEWLTQGKFLGVDSMVAVAAVLTILVILITILLLSKRSVSMALDGRLCMRWS